MKPAVVLNFFIGFLLISASHLPILGANSADADNRFLAMPSANFNLDQDLLVPLEVVKKIALEKAQELWGQVKSGNPIPCCDEDGDIVTYMCTFHIGKEPFPSYEQIMEGVKEGRRLVEEVEIGFFSQGSAGGQDTDASDIERHSDGQYASAPYPAESELTRGTAPEPPGKVKGESFQEELKKAKEKELGIGEYGTIYVSARYDRYPIPLCSHYLSPYYFTGDLARKKATKVLGGDPHLAQYYFLGYRGQYFEFVSGQKKVLVHAYSLEIKSFEPVERAMPTAEQLEDIMEEWDRIVGTTEAEKGGES